MGNRPQQPSSTTQSSSGVCLSPKLIPAAAAFALANSGGRRCTSRGERQGTDTPVYLSAHMKRGFLHQLQSAASLKLL